MNPRKFIVHECKRKENCKNVAYEIEWNILKDKSAPKGYNRFFISTGAYDDYLGEYGIEINFCPFCGKKLKGLVK